MKTSRFFIGQIVRPRGLKGECKAQLFIDSFSHIENLTRVFLDQTEMKVQHSQIEGVFGYFKFEGVDTVEAAEELRQKKLYVERENLVAKDGRFFVSDLISMDVFLDEKLIGNLIDVLQYGAADVYVVKIENGEVVSFPALKKLIKTVDVENNKMVLDGGVFKEVAVYQNGKDDN